MPLLPTALDLTKLHLNKFFQSRYNPNFYHDLLKAEQALNNEEEKLFPKKKIHLKKLNQHKPTLLLQNKIIPKQIINHNFNSISNQTHNNEQLTEQLFNYLHRPIPQYLRSHQLNTKEWFYTQNTNILLNK